MLTGGYGHHPFKVTLFGWGSIPPRNTILWAVGRATDATGSYPVPAGFDSPAAYQDRFILFLFTYIGLAKPIFRFSVEAAR